MLHDVLLRRLELRKKLRAILDKLAKFGVTPNLQQDDSPLAQSVRITVSALRRDLDEAELGIMKLRYFCERLEQIAGYDARLLRKFLRRLKTKRTDDYLGVLCEINTACCLIGRRVEFCAPDPPDFLIRKPHALIQIECTSVRMEGQTNKELHYKMESAINKKAKKGYCDARTALVISITSIMHQSHATGWLMTPQTIRMRFESLAERCGFGCIVLICLVGDIGGPRNKLSLSYLRLDGKKMTKDLAGIMDKVFPHGSYTVTRMIIPRSD